MQTLRARAREEALLGQGRPTLVMLSGGRDSTCLLDVAVAIRGAGAVSALHVNYGLRPAADEDERHCAFLCERLWVPLAVHRPQRPASGNLQAWAREERYAAARAYAPEPEAEIATGHTADDQVETILYRLASSPSRRALLGMRAREGRLVRPLLSTTRAETTAYCQASGLTWREDESNAGDRFARGRIRHELIPALRRVHPAAEANVLALAATLREEAAVLDQAVEEILRGRGEIGLGELRALPAALARLVVQRLADSAAGRPAPGAARRTAEVIALGDNAALDLPHGVRAVVRRGTLRMVVRT